MNMNYHMKTSQTGLDLIKKWEGCILKQYICPAGKPTIGIGHVVLPSEKFPEKITEKDALDILAKDVSRFEKAIYENVKIPLNQNQFDALVCFLFNTGEGGIVGSGLQRALNSGDFSKAPEEIMKWCKFRDKGVMKVNVGLQNRRKSEVELFVKPWIWDSPQQPQKLVSIVKWDRTSLTEVQQMLSKLGLYNIKVDGLWGPSTEKALKAFAVRCSYTLADPRGGIPDDLLDELKKQSAAIV